MKFVSTLKESKVSWFIKGMHSGLCLSLRVIKSSLCNILHSFLKIYLLTSWWRSELFCFVFLRSRVQFLARRLAILSDFVAFYDTTAHFRSQTTPLLSTSFSAHNSQTALPFHATYFSICEALLRVNEEPANENLLLITVIFLSFCFQILDKFCVS
jgi:hypothetical protein